MIRQDIQGLRALAVGSILLFHAFPALMPGGFVGVDIFFVISGYLITGIILRDTEAGRFSVAEFYRRRIRRIFPALFVMLATCLVAALWLMAPRQMQELGRNTLSAILFVSNFDFYLLTGYFDGAADLKPLLHTWSLSVEEQFYILFPPVTYYLWRHHRSKTVPIMLAGFVLSLAFAELLRWKSPTAAFYFTPGRGFELLTGALLAFGLAKPPSSQRMANALSLAGLALILATILIYHRAMPFPGATALIPCIGTALVIHAGQTNATTGGQAISHAPMRLLGDMSYSLYLWHWPILAFLRLRHGEHLPVEIAGAGLIASLVAGYLSYRYIEQPFLAPARKTLPYLQIGAGLIAGMAAVAFFVNRSGGVPMRFTPEVLARFAAADDVNPERPTCHNNGGPAVAYASTCVFGARAIPADTVVWADSHGAELAYVLGEVAGQHRRSLRQITSSACPPALDYAPKDRPHCRAGNHATFAALVADPAVKTVVLAVNPPRYPEAEALASGLAASVRGLRNAGKRVVLLGPIPIMRTDPPADLGLTLARGGDVTRLGMPRAEHDTGMQAIRALYARLVAEYGVDLHEPAARLCDDTLCRIHHPEVAGGLYFNNDHLSRAGIAFAARGLIDSLYP